MNDQFESFFPDQKNDMAQCGDTTLIFEMFFSL